MNERDIRAVIQWFKTQVKVLENSKHYGETREGLNRGLNSLEGFVKVLEGELDGSNSKIIDIHERGMKYFSR